MFKITITSDAKVRARCGLTTSDVSTTDMTAILAQVDIEIQNIVESEFYFSEFFDNQEDERVLIMNDYSTVSDFIKIEIDGEEVFEENKQELMDNIAVEEIDSSATGGVEDWESASSTSATYTHADTPHRGRKSLQITSGAEEEAYWETTSDITVDYPQSNQLKAFRLTYYVKTTSVDEGDNSGAYAKILWYNGSDTLLETDSDSANAVTGTADWAKLTMTKYAPDTASHAEIRCVLDGVTGDAYFDSFKFRRVNWVDKIADASIDLLKPYPGNFIAIWYSKTDTVNPLVENLATDMAARASLVHATGGTMKGVNYKIDVLSVNKGKQSTERRGLLKQLDLAIEEKIMRLREQGLLKDVKNDWKVGDNIL